MNLKVLFNFRYFKENIRKSKGLLAFFLGVVPIINIIILISILTLGGDTLVDFKSLSLSTYLGLYIIPIVLSISLFGFIFKKKSVDFVMSKPISRKSIFLTNTIGGILVLILFMLINTIIFGLFGLFFSKLTIPIALLLDYFLFWSIAYIFMFMVSNLCVSLAGNFITSLILIVIVICIIPYFRLTNNLFNNYYGNTYIKCSDEACKPDSYYCYEDEKCLERLTKEEYYLYFTEETHNNFTAPLIFLNDQSGISYNTISLYKMLSLSIIYGLLGYILFKKRKMENNETDFKSDLAHYLVKTICFLPVCLLTYVIIKEGLVGWLISLAIIIIFYIVYDLIVRKEIYKLRKSLFIALVTFGIFIGGYSFYDYLSDNKEITINQVDKIVLNDNYHNLEIEDKELINKIMKSSLDNVNDTYYYSDGTIISNKKRYSFNFNMTPELETEVASRINHIRKEDLKNFNYDSIDYIAYENTMIPITKEIKTLIKDSIENYDESKNYTEVLIVYDYKNHDYEYIGIPITLNEDLYKKVITYQNDLFLKKLEKARERNTEIYFSLNTEDNNIFTELDRYVFNYVINSNIDLFIKYFKTDNDISLKTNSILIDFYKNEQVNGTIGDITSFKEEFDSYKERLANNSEYLRLLEEFQNMNSEAYYEY